MDELGAQLDRHRSGPVSSSDASPVLARFVDNDIETGDIENGIVQCARAVTPAALSPTTSSTSAFNFVIAMRGNKKELC